MNRTIKCFILMSALTLAAMRAGSTGDPSNEGRRFFYDAVLPKLSANGCPACHGVGYMHPNVTIYEELLRRLAIGDSPTNNAVIYKIANVQSIRADRPEHPGGQRCASVDTEPCASIQRWWRIEFGGHPPQDTETVDHK